MDKKAIVAIIHAMNINKKPTNNMVNIEPMNKSVPAVSNMCSPDFCARLLKDFLKFIAANT